MLFSEPKIPQIILKTILKISNTMFQCSSASRKFLNHATIVLPVAACPFQCSSASRKFLNAASAALRPDRHVRFSALQRAENSSTNALPPHCARRRRFSALQRAENSSIAQHYHIHARSSSVSVLFSEPKIPQSADES